MLEVLFLVCSNASFDPVPSHATIHPMLFL